jgi:hypothetical protein
VPLASSSANTAVGALRPGQALRYKLSLAEPGLDALCRAFWQHPAVAAAFPEYLFGLWSSMRATLPLLQAAAARARELSDPLSARLLPYFLEHADEERGHDDWLLEDMEGFGIPRAEVFARLPPPDVAAMIGTQYYFIAHAHPVALLGCFAVLEGSPLTEPDLSGLSARAAIPRPLLRTLDKHALLDPHHRDDLDALVDGLPLEPWHQALLGLSALTVVEQLGCIVERLRDLADAAATA